MDEIWVEVVGYEGRYLISSFGRVYSILAKRIIKTCISNAGYELACLKNADGKRNQRTVHRLVAVAFLDNPNDLPIINHKDENKLNNKTRYIINFLRERNLIHNKGTKNKPKWILKK